MKDKDRRLYSSKYAGTYLASSKHKYPRLPIQTVVSGSPQQTGASTHNVGHAFSGQNWYKGGQGFSNPETRLISAKTGGQIPYN